MNMIEINNPTILNEIIKNLFKKKRNVPHSISITPECDTMIINWKNGHCTKIVDMFICMDIRIDKDSGMYGIITLNPKRNVKKQYRFTTFVFDITNFRKGEVYD
ncbi:MAG: hypothetical protein VZQ98_15420 [Bacteroidales bacterium]|nr:hypothetical protein [Bacteroidales bacterium]